MNSYIYCGHRLVWLGHWPSMHISCEVSPQPGTLFKAGIQIPVTAICIGIHIVFELEEYLPLS